MDCELYSVLYQAVFSLGKRRRPKGAIFTDADIAWVFLWAVGHDRGNSWACQRRHWPLWHRRPLPSPSTLSRRLRTESVQALLRDLEAYLRLHAPASICRFIDAKPLPIGGCSQDKQAGFGRAAGCMAKGYKLHAIIDIRQGIVAWEVVPMNVSERTLARRLIPELHSPGYLVGDYQYDAAPLYDLAALGGVQLVAPRKRGAKGLGHRRQSPHRLRGLELLGRGFGQNLLRARGNVERWFGNMTAFGGGLGPLPSWVRGLGRVTNWVRAKSIICAVHRQLLHRVAA
jgi:hypothetical protein